MRLGVFILLNLIFATVAVRADEILPVLKVGAEVFSNVTVISVTSTEIYFTSDKGFANAKLKNLDPALQEHFKNNSARSEVAAVSQKAPDTASSPPTIERTNAQSIMDDAIARVKAIVNQPVHPLARTPEMNDIPVYSPDWFHPGATKPDFNTVDVRATQETKYSQHAYAASEANPSAIFVGSELEFNSMTKYFYVDRSLPKKKLTEAEMLEINRLYRVIGNCESKLALSRDAAAAASDAHASWRGYLSFHKNVIIGVSLAAVALLLVIRFLTGSRNS